VSTIAWDGHTLAADSQCTIGAMPCQTIKIRKLADGRLYGHTGNAEDGAAVFHWLETGGEKPEVKDFAALLVGINGQLSRLEDKLVAFPVNSPFHAAGSGRDYAIAAMHLGKTAREAVELACLYDIYTGGPITEITLGTIDG